MGDTVHIRVLGTSFTIQTDQKPEYVEKLISYVQEKVHAIETTAGSKENLKTAILVSVLLADELFQARSADSRDGKDPANVDEIERYAHELIKRIDATLDADATALALSLMNEQLLLEMVCRNEASPEEYARVAGPIWEAALFGRPSKATTR